MKKMNKETLKQAVELLKEIKSRLETIYPAAEVGFEKVEEINNAEIIRYMAMIEIGGRKINAQKLILMPVKEGREIKEAAAIVSQIERELIRKGSQYYTGRRKNKC